MSERLKKMKVCPKCSVMVNPENLRKHMRKAHGIEPEAELMQSLKDRTGGKKEKLAALRKKNRNIMAIVGLMIVLALVGVAYYYLAAPQSEAQNPSPSTPAPSDSSPNIVIDEANITNTAKFMSYNSNGVAVRFFLVRGGDGKVHLAADACDVCYKNKKGYTQVGDVMKCNNCGKTFAINSIGTENIGGGCWPSYVPYSEDGVNITIKKSDLDAKRYMFQ